MPYEVPPVESTSDEEQILAHALELYRSRGKNGAETQAYWPTARPVAVKFAGTVKQDSIPGSWNHPVAGAVLLALMENDRWEDLRQYCIKQLDGRHRGFWGSESHSHIYPQPITCLAVAFEQRQMPEMRKVLRAHAYLLALQALPRPYLKEAGEQGRGESAWSDRSLPFHVCCGGMRSQWPYRGNVYLSYALWTMLSVTSTTRSIPTWRQTHRRIQGWPFRIMAHTSHDYLSPEDRQLLSGHVETPNPQPIVAELQALGVTSRATLEIARYPQGQGYSFFARNTHSSTPPLMAQSQVGGGYHTLGLHPESHRGGPRDRDNKVGEVAVSREARRIVGRVEGIVAGGNLGAWPPLDSPETARGNVTASIPIPEGEPLYRVVIDRQGIRFSDSTGVPTPPPTPTPTPQPQPGPADIRRALSLIDQAIPGAALERPARTAAEVLRRLIRGDRAGGARGAGTLERLLAAAPSPQVQPADDPRIREALGLIDRAIPGTALERQARTAAEVLKRILRGNRDGALTGTRTLSRILA